MYKINDIVYLYLKGTKLKYLEKIDLNLSRFAKITNIQEFDKETVYTVEMISFGKTIEISNRRGAFTFLNINELIDKIRSLNVEEQRKNEHLEKINNILSKIQ